MVSRYGIIPNDLRIHAMTLNIGQGLADRFNTPDAMRFIVDAERIAEEQSSEFVAVPLKPAPVRPGLIPPATPTDPQPPVPPDFPPPQGNLSSFSPEVSVIPQGLKWNFPPEFIQAVIFFAIAAMLRSEFFEAEPNTSQISIEADARAENYIYLFRTRPTVLVAAGRRRNANPHIPPNIAPRGTINIGPPGSR
jgi:hypothetical protein